MKVRWRNRTLIYFRVRLFRLSRHAPVTAAASNTLKENGLNVADLSPHDRNHKNLRPVGE